MFKYREVDKKYHGSVFSFGSGIQSTAIFVLLLHEPDRLQKAVGHLPEYIVFADTGAEKEKSLANFEQCQAISPVPMYRIKNEQRNAKTHPLDIPVFFPGNSFNMRRKCTTEWKIKPVRRMIKKLYPNKSKKNQIALWMGISIDEITRMRVSQLKSIEHIYPLIDLQLNRSNCEAILAKYNWEAEKSSCWMCPFQSPQAWIENSELNKAIAYEREIQELSYYRETPYLHRSCEPIGEVVKKKQQQTNLFSFDDECEGYCGL